MSWSLGLDRSRDLEESLKQCWHDNDIWLKYLDIEAHAESIMIAVVRRVLSEVKVRQLWAGIPGVCMVDDAPSDMGRTLHMLLEAQVKEHSGHKIFWLPVKAHVEVASDDGWLLHVDHLL